MPAPRYNSNALPVYAAQLPQVGRVPRRPKHQFQLVTMPFGLQPFLFAPVLPGETLKNLLLQSRVVTDPLHVSNKLIGWWKEYYFFYVKHRDLLTDNEMAGESTYRNFLTNMVLDPTLAPPAAEAAAPKYHHAGGTVNWCLHATRSVVYHWFRDQGESVTGTLIDGLMPVSAVAGTGVYNIFDSLTLDDAIPQTDIPETGDITDLDRAYMVWEFMRMQGQTDLTYEDFLRSYGVAGKAAAEAVRKPELIRYLKEWTYPTNTVEPTTGVPTTAASWSIQERADKDRFFSEPGWILGLTCTRPKVYFNKQKGSLAHFMQDVFTWLPPSMQQDYQGSLKKFAQGTGPVPSIADADGYWLDIRDLFMYGEEFKNTDMTAGTSGQNSAINLPTTAANARFPVQADAEGYFASAPSGQYVREDGIVQLHILGRQKDMT